MSPSTVNSESAFSLRNHRCRYTFVTPAVFYLSMNRVDEAMVGLMHFLFSVARLDILIQAEEIAGIIFRFDSYHPLPLLLVRFCHAVLLVATHEIYIDTGFHRPPQLLEE